MCSSDLGISESTSTVEMDANDSVQVGPVGGSSAAASARSLLYDKQLRNVTGNLGPPIIDMVESALGNWVQPWWVRHWTGVQRRSANRAVHPTRTRRLQEHFRTQCLSVIARPHPQQESALCTVHTTMEARSRHNMNHRPNNTKYQENKSHTQTYRR